MLRFKPLLLLLFFSCPVLVGQAQVVQKQEPVLIGSSEVKETAALSEKTLIPASGEIKIYNPKNRSANRVVPGKGYPKGMDAALQKKEGKIPSKKPLLTFDAATSGSTPTDPTGAVGPDHYVNAWNSAFAIYDKEGNVLSPPADLMSIGGTFADEDLGDPIVFYDYFADRFVLTQFSDTPNSLLVAVSKGPDPVNDGWYTYRFVTGALPDYPKFFVWSDGYYVTTNKDPEEPDSNEVVYVLERDKMLQGLPARHVGFPLPGIVNNGFYSPAGFFAVGNQPPPPGNTPIIYYQDDAWLGVNEDHLKLWEITMDWENLENASISEFQTIGPEEGLTPFHSTFDGGSFLNLSQPGDAPDVDALQGAIMYPTAYRRFEDHNSVVFNFVVDVDPSQVEHAGIRWYELRQDEDGERWRIFQEGTYAPDNSDRWCGSIGIDKNGNIGLGFTILNDNPEDPIFPSLMYTGRYAGDPPGVMTIKEEPIAISTAPDPSSRYGDYAHLTVDPTDGETFWYIGEYFRPGSRLNKVGVFKIAPEFFNDVGVVDIIAPHSATLGTAEPVTVVLRNYGRLPQSDIPVTVSVDGKVIATEVFEGTIASTAQAEFTFSQGIDLSESGATYSVSVGTRLDGDQDDSNDILVEEVENLPPDDIGVTVIHSPRTGDRLGDDEVIGVTIENFGGEPQTGFPVAYKVDDGPLIVETYDEVLEVGEQAAYIFEQQVDLSRPGVYKFFATTLLEGDADEENDAADKVVAQLNCLPEGSDCAFGDGIFSFYLEEIQNDNIYCTNGYYDFIGLYTRLDRSQGTYTVGVATHFAERNHERFSLWIDFNDNAVFEDEERLISAAIIPTAREVYSYDFSIPPDAPLGEHLMRVRGGDTSYGGNLNNPCSVMDYGTTQDYTVLIVDSIEDSELADSELVVSSAEGDIFDIDFTTGYQKSVWITVYNLLGQKLVENKIEKGLLGYEYVLDMSYAAPGVYLVRVGTREEGRVERILVH